MENFQAMPMTPVSIAIQGLKDRELPFFLTKNIPTVNVNHAVLLTDHFLQVLTILTEISVWRRKIRRDRIWYVVLC